MEQELKIYIESWLKKDPDYNSGLALLIQVCKNKTLLRNLSRRETPNNLKKIAWELRKSIGATGLKTNTGPSEKKKTEKQIGILGSAFSAAGKKLAAKITSYPKTIETIISLNGKLSNDRDILHRSLKEIPEANNDANNEKRQKVVDKIRLISDHLEHLYKIKDLYFTEKIIPTEEDLYLPEKQIPKAKKKAKPDPIDKMTEAQLLKKRTNMRSNLTKKKNKLRFQSTSKKKEENPMPAGVKRDFLIEQIKEAKNLLKEIQTKIDGFSKSK